jgi:hypothetical protein
VHGLATGRHLHVYAGALTRLAADVEPSAEALRALAHDLQSEVSATLRGLRHSRVKANAVVFDGDVPVVRIEPEANRHSAGVGVLAHIRERFLHDAQELDLGNWW